MLAEYRAAADFDRPRQDRIDAQVLETERGGNDIDYGIRRADLMKVDLLQVDSMHIGFGFAERPEHADRALLHGGAVSGAFDDVDDLCEMTMGSGHIIAQDNRSPGTRDAHLGRSLDFQPEFGLEGEFLQLTPQVVHRHAHIDHGADVHVARDAAEAVVEKGPGHG